MTYNRGEIPSKVFTEQKLNRSVENICRNKIKIRKVAPIML